ncbi:MAG: metal-dependent hydrolase [Halanaeroarchaeum sp.]
MFVGHGAIAFAAVGLAALASGMDRQRAIAIALLAGLFATAPDVDMIYALSGLVDGTLSAPRSLVTSFWAASTVVHRSVTHSVLVALPATLVFATFGRTTRQTLLSAATGLAIVAMAARLDGAIAALVAAAFIASGAAIGLAAVRANVPQGHVAGAALVGLVTHPFGDVLTGQPPQLLYPLPAPILEGRVLLSSDPTVHLLGAFALEIAALWLAALTVARFRDARLRSHVRPRAVLGAAYGTAILVLPAPTVDASYHFVFSVLAMGLVGVAPIRRRIPRPTTALITGLAGVTVAVTAYAIAYLTIGIAPL